MTAAIRKEDAELVRRVPRSLRAANGIPEPDQAAARERAAELASEALADLLLPRGVRTSPLGPGWSRDIDMHLSAQPEPARLKALGYIHLDPLLRRLGNPEPGNWAVVEDRRVLAALDLHVGPPPDPVASLLGRCRRRGEVRVREVLEARALLDAGHDFPPDDAVVRVLAGVEAGLGGHAFARWSDGRARPAPAALPGGSFRRRLAVVRSALRPRPTVAISGVDGSGKTTLSQLLTRNLERAGIPATYVWARPGKMGNKTFESLVRVVKRLLRQDASSWGITQVVRGAPTGELASRRGLVGWVWTMVVTLWFLADVRGQQLRNQGVFVCDRYILDALVQLDLAYRGVDLRFHRAVVRRGLPKPLLSVYLDASAEVVLARRPEELEDIYSGEYVIRRQLASYETHRGGIERLLRLDANRPADELAEEVARWLAES